MRERKLASDETNSFCLLWTLNWHSCSRRRGRAGFHEYRAAGSWFRAQRRTAQNRPSAQSERVWEQVKYLTNFNLPVPRVEVITNRYTELGAGICYEQPDGKWADSHPRFVLTPDGSVEATEIPHKVRISPDLRSIAAVKMTLPDGRMMSSTFRGLYLHDRATQKRLLVSDITNSIGTLISSNVLVYSNCFASLKGDLVLKVTPAGLGRL